MKSLLTARRMLVLLVATVAAGAFLWPIPYNDVAMISRSFLITWIGTSTVAGLIGQFLLRKNVAITATLVALGFCCAAMARVIVETIPDPTSHNLWPFEVAIAAVVGLGGGLAGATVGLLIGFSVTDS